MRIITATVAVSCSNKPAARQLWTCPMHPYYITDKPGDCPICGMKLVPVEKTQGPEPKSPTGEKTGNSMAGMPGMENMAGMGAKEISQPADRVVIKIDPEKQQLINIKTDVVTKRSLGNSVLASGVVAYDPELYYTQQQYISASLSLRKAQAAGDENGISTAKDSISSAATRLKVMGLSDQQINELGGKVGPDKSLLISGQGGDVWVYAQVYQDDLKYVRRGAQAEVTLSSSQNEVFEGRVVAIDPALNPETRSIRVRVLVKDTAEAFKPEMYVNVKIKSPTGSYLSVPEEAIMDTGTKNIAFVDKGDGYFEPRYVVLGAKIDEYYVVQFGLAEGEKVVTNANFLIDSESQLKAAIGQMSTGEK